MKTIIPIYIDKESMLWIAENRIHSRNFISIFKNRAQLFLDMTEEEIDDMDDISDYTNWNVISKYLSDDIMITPKSGKEVFINFYERYNSDKISDEFNGFVFIIDIPIEEAKILRENTGIWILSIKEVDDEGEFLILEEGIYINKHTVTPGSKYNENSANGWVGLLKHSRINKLPPINEVIVYDNFLNDYYNYYKESPYGSKKKINYKTWFYTYIGLENLLLLFDTLFPQKHTNPLKVLIVAPKQNKDYEALFELRIKDWVDEIKRLRSYNIIVSCVLVASHPVHPRVLYTNYFILETDKGFKIFEPIPFPTIVRKDGDSINAVSLQSLFFAPKSQDNPIKSNYNKYLKDIGEQLQNANNNNSNYQTNLHIGDEIDIESIALFEDIIFGN